MTPQQKRWLRGLVTIPAVLALLGAGDKAASAGYDATVGKRETKAEHKASVDSLKARMDFRDYKDSVWHAEQGEEMLDILCSPHVDPHNRRCTSSNH